MTKATKRWQGFALFNAKKKKKKSEPQRFINHKIVP